MPLASIILLLLVVLAVYKGWTQGLIMALFTFVSYFIALALAFQFSGWLAGVLHKPGEGSDRLYGFLAFILVMIAGMLAVRLLGKLVEGAVKLMLLGTLNRILGIFLFLLIYITLYAIILFYAEKLGWYRVDHEPEYLETLRNYGRWIIGMSSEWIPVIRNTFNDTMEVVKQKG